MGHRYSRTTFCLLCTLGLAACAAAQTADPVMGDWKGTARTSEGVSTRIVAQVIALADGTYRANLLGDFDRRIRPLGVLDGKRVGERVVFTAVPGIGNPANTWSGQVADGVFTGTVKGLQNGTFQLRKTQRLSPALGRQPPAGAVVLFDGSNLDQWYQTGEGGSHPATWKLVEGGAMEIVPKSGSLLTRRKLGDFELHLEFRVPFLLGKAGQGRGNSGVYIQGRYEVQILDSYGAEGRNNECGALYKYAAPRVNMAAPPLQWQTYDITFRAPRFDAAGKKTENARVTVVHNGVTVHDDLELPGPTGAAKGKREVPTESLVLQDHGNPVQFRNIWVLEK